VGSVSAAALIIGITFFISFTMVYSASMDNQFKLNQVMMERENANRHYYDTSIKISNVIYSGSSLKVYIDNTGNTTLNPYFVTFVVNGTAMNSQSVKVSGVETSVWAPGEVAVFTLNYPRIPFRIKAITEFGNSAYYEV